MIQPSGLTHLQKMKTQASGLQQCRVKTCISQNLIMATFLSLCLLVAPRVRAQYSYTTLNDPLGVNGTYVYGVSGNDMVGYYLDAGGIGHGFIYDGSTYTTLNDPSATQGTFAYDISGNLIVGQYNDGSGQHGFEYNLNTGSYTTLPVPANTAGSGISGNTVVGGYQPGSISHGFIYDGTTYSTLDIGTGGTTLNSVSGD